MHRNYPARMRYLPLLFSVIKFSKVFLAFLLHVTCCSKGPAYKFPYCFSLYRNANIDKHNPSNKVTFYQTVQILLLNF